MAEARRHRAEEPLDEWALVGMIGRTHLDGATQELASDLEAVSSQMRPGMIKANAPPARVAGFR